MLGEVRKVSAKGMAAKRAGKIVAFKVTAQGPGCVLSAIYKNGERWVVYVCERESVSRKEVLKTRCKVQRLTGKKVCNMDLQKTG
jgi:hypothetical protein